MKFVLVDLSNGAKTTNGESLTPEILKNIATAVNVQLNRDFSIEYGGTYWVRAGADKNDIKNDEYTFAILDTITNAPGAIAYHTSNGNGIPLLFDGLELSYSVTGIGNSVSAAISHELLETAADPGANLWAADNISNNFAREVCDPFENRSYIIDGIGVSDFALNAYFIPGAAGPYSFGKKLGTFTEDSIGPLTTNGNLGYQMVSLFSPQSIHQMAMRKKSVVEVIGEMKRRPIAHESSRRNRRGFFQNT